MKKNSIYTLFYLLSLLSFSAHAQQKCEGYRPFPFSLQYFEIAEDKEFVPSILDDLRAHGVSNLWIRDCKSQKSNDIVKRFQEEGFRIDLMTHGHENFTRDEAPKVSVYAPEYEEIVGKNVKNGLAQLSQIAHPDYVFPYIDEPFHRKPFLDYSAATRTEFEHQYGYAMPKSFEEACKSPRTQLDFLNFQSCIFRDGWMKTAKIVHEFDPRVKIAITHDSHNVYGGGVNSNSQMAMDDVFHWGGNFADLFVYDIYPYLTFDYRYGETGVYRKPRMSQLHYTMAQLRNMTTTYGKKMGFWVGTYNKAWFVRFRGKERAEQFWSEHEVLYTAIAGGSDYIISPSDYMGHNLPVDQNHWDEYGRGMRIIQKEGAAIADAPKVKANACFLFPRTQYLLTQEEYYNVGLSYELFLRAFGELDILHEDQIIDDTLNGYQALVLCDVTLLPEKVAEHIVRFVKNGGTVIADCVPQMNENKKTSTTMSRMFGVANASTKRVKREGQWVPFVNLPAKYSFPPVNGVTDTNYQFDTWNTMQIVSPRTCKVTGATIKGSSKADIPLMLTNRVGKGNAILFGFCMQDTYFQACKTEDQTTLNALYNQVHNVFAESGIVSHVYSSNPELEAGLRSSCETAYLFIINHEAQNGNSQVALRQLPGKVVKVIDVESGCPVVYTLTTNGIDLNVNVPFGKKQLIKITYQK